MPEVIAHTSEPPAQEVMHHRTIGICGTSGMQLSGSSAHACNVGQRSLPLAHRKAGSSVSWLQMRVTLGLTRSSLPGMPQAHPPSSRQKSGEPHGFLSAHMALLPSRGDHVIKAIVKPKNQYVKNENRPTGEIKPGGAVLEPVWGVISFGRFGCVRTDALCACRCALAAYHSSSLAAC